MWALVDVDNHRTLPDARQLARQEAIELAVSNPCFELWGILHFVRHAAHLSPDGAVRLLGEHIPGYGKPSKRLDCTHLEGGFDNAREHAIWLRRKHEDEGRTDPNPSSAVYQFVDALLDAARTAAPNSQQVNGLL